MYTSISDNKESFYVEASAVNTFLYCKRRYYYEYIQQEFESNVHTLLGDQAHESVDEFGEIERRGKIIYKAVKLISDKYEVSLKVDTIEEFEGEFYPVEYKKGKKKIWKNDKYQMILQCMLMEELLNIKVRKGFIYYVGSKERVEFKILEEDKLEILKIIEDIKNVYQSGEIPVGCNDNRCNSCSIKNICLPLETKILIGEK